MGATRRRGRHNERDGPLVDLNSHVMSCEREKGMKPEKESGRNEKKNSTGKETTFPIHWGVMGRLRPSRMQSTLFVKFTVDQHGTPGLGHTPPRLAILLIETHRGDEAAVLVVRFAA